MINLEVDYNYIYDLQDDFFVNTDKDFYRFIGGDPVRAFYLGINMDDWFDKLETKEQQYLYTKQMRHNGDSLEKYQSQIMHWCQKYPSEKDIDLVNYSQYVLNNMLFWDREHEDEDTVKLAFLLGKSVKEQQKEENNEESSDIH